MIQRYELNPHDGECGIEKDADGAYVTFADYELLHRSHEHLTDALQSAIDRLKGREWDVDLRSRLQIALEDFHGER